MSARNRAGITIRVHVGPSPDPGRGRPWRRRVATWAVVTVLTACAGRPQPPSRSLVADLPPAAPLVAPAGSPWHVPAPPPPGYDREDAARRTLDLLAQLVALDTSNPPARERLVADVLDARLRGLPGVRTQVVEAGDDPARANFLARLFADGPGAATAGEDAAHGARSGGGLRRPVLILAHMDVVGAQRERWTSDPFVPAVRDDGKLYGRGVIDDKGMLAAATVAFETLAARRDTLDRDVILLATAGEEGGDPVGIERLVERHGDLLGGAEFALNEGGRIRVVDGRVQSVNLQTTEKVYYDVTATATGPSGHGSVPLPDNALAALARAVARVHGWRPEPRLNPTTRRFFAGIATLEQDPARAAAMAAIGGDDEAAARAGIKALSADPLANAILRTGIALTELNGGFRANVIPSSGAATFNVRVLPGDDVNAIVDGMQQAGGEPAVSFRLVGEPKEVPPVSPASGALWDALSGAAAAMAPGALVVPYMSTGGTDGAVLRAHGIPTYGILPFPLELTDELRMHGDDERVPVAAIGWGTELLYRTLLGVSSVR